MMHEAQLHEENAFVTLTYSEDHLPEYGSLRKVDFQLFMKRLRKRISPQLVRFFHAGEYGESLRRPHYHACFFGFGFPDRQSAVVRNGHPVWRSQVLDESWGLGIAEGGELTFESAAYVARYVTKKITGRAAEDHYSVVDADTGQVVELEREYATMSRRPGIGAGWFARFGKEVYPRDEVVMRGAVMKPPRFYDQLLDRVDAEQLALVRRERRLSQDCWNSSESRLAVREKVAVARLDRFANRSMEAQ